MLQDVLLKNVEIPEGYEATGEWRFPLPGEPFLTCTGKKQVCIDSDQCERRMYRIILRKSWTPEPWTPEPWMPEGAWLYKNYFDNWVLRVGSEPYDTVLEYGDEAICIDLLPKEMLRLLNWTPPPVNKIQIRHKS